MKGKDRTLTGVGTAAVDEGDAVFKSGRTTGPTAGRITAFDLDNVVVNYEIGNLRFDGQIEIEGTGNAPFSDGGDSGSLIVNAGMEAAALLFAGGDSGGSNGLGLTFANPIERVLKDLKATLLFCGAQSRNDEAIMPAVTLEEAKAAKKTALRLCETVASVVGVGITRFGGVCRQNQSERAGRAEY